MVRDEESGKISAFFVAPVKRGYYVAGYVIAAIIGLLYHVPAHIDNRSHLSWYC